MIGQSTGIAVRTMALRGRAAKCPHAVLVAGKQPNARIDDPPITALSLKHG